MQADLFDQITWTDDGLLPAIAQDAQSGKVLMMAWMNRESLAATIKEQYAIYWSRSRQKLWRKGETSGNLQKIHNIRLDCDGDTLLLLVEQIGGIACHTGRESCFFQELSGTQWQTIEPILKDPKDLYS